MSLTVTASGASAEFDCATGTVDEPMYVDRNGRFDADGWYGVEAGGPQQTGMEGPKAQRARYEGSTDGSSMDVTVTLTETGDDVDSFHLERGRQAHLERCL